MMRGEKVLLRAPESHDVESLHRWMNDAEVTRWLGRRFPISLSQVRAWAEEEANPSREIRLVIETLEGQAIGWCDLTRWNALEPSAVFTLSIGEKTVWGHGYGTDATLTLSTFGFAQLNLHRLGLFVFAENASAIHIYEKCGFQHEGRLRESGYRHGGYHDVLIMGILVEEFRARWPQRWQDDDNGG